MTEDSSTYLKMLGGTCTLGGHFVAPVGRVWAKPSPHAFSQNKFYFITGGSCRLSIDGRDYEGRAGDWFLIPAGVPHTYENDSTVRFEKYWMHFELFPDNRLAALLSLPHCVKVERGGRAYRLFREYTRAAEGRHLGDAIAVKGILLSLVAEYTRLAYPDGIEPGAPADDAISATLTYIRHHLAERLDVGTLAARAYLHPTHFIRAFRERTGDTPARYVRRARMEAARRYLEEGELSIKEIMARIGEEDIFGFSKRFKARYSYSPREYRRHFPEDGRR